MSSEPEEGQLDVDEPLKPAEQPATTTSITAASASVPFPFKKKAKEVAPAIYERPAEVEEKIRREEERAAYARSYKRKRRSRSPDWDRRKTWEDDSYIPRLNAPQTEKRRRQSPGSNRSRSRSRSLSKSPRQPVAHRLPEAHSKSPAATSSRGSALSPRPRSYADNYRDDRHWQPRQDDRRYVPRDRDYDRRDYRDRDYSRDYGRDIYRDREYDRVTSYDDRAYGRGRDIDREWRPEDGGRHTYEYVDYNRQYDHHADYRAADDWRFNDYEPRSPAYRPVSPQADLPQGREHDIYPPAPVSPDALISPPPVSSLEPGQAQASAASSAPFTALDVIKAPVALPNQVDLNKHHPPAPRGHPSPTPLPTPALAVTRVDDDEDGQVVDKPITLPKPLKPRRKPIHLSRAEEEKNYGRIFVGCGEKNDYTMTTKLGEGTFGEVHKAIQERSSRTVALKRILMHNEREGMPVTALREIKILKALKHPSIIELLDMFVVRGPPTQKSKDGTGGSGLSVYMIFPYMDHDLAGLLENERVTLIPSQVKLYMRQLLEGTAYMHRNHILHRDMKAANLLISNKGELRIADFGLARAYDPEVAVRWRNGQQYSESTNGTAGARDKDRKYTNCVVTRWYRPPELLLGARHYGGEIDMWGVGCVFGEMFTRKPILPGTSDIDQLDKIWQLCGSPNQHNWPNYDELPGCEGQKKWPTYPRKVKKIYAESVGYEPADLLDKLLTCNPRDRITAEQALDHDYFWTDPLPADPKTLPTYEPSHEIDKRSRRPPMPMPIPGPPQNYVQPMGRGPPMPGPMNMGIPPPAHMGGVPPALMSGVPPQMHMGGPPIPMPMTMPMPMPMPMSMPMAPGQGYPMPGPPPGQRIPYNAPGMRQFPQQQPGVGRIWDPSGMPVMNGGGRPGSLPPRPGGIPPPLGRGGRGRPTQNQPDGPSLHYG